MVSAMVTRWPSGVHFSRTAGSHQPDRPKTTLSKTRRQTMAEKLDLVLERTIDAPVELVWQAYTNAEHLKKWFAPRPYEITECELDPRPGGIFRIRMVGPDGFDTGHGNAGCVI